MMNMNTVMMMIFMMTAVTVANADERTGTGGKEVTDTTLLKEAPSKKQGDFTTQKGLKYSATQLSQKGDWVELNGNARVSDGAKDLKAEKILLNVKTGKAKASGAVHFQADEFEVEFPRDSK